MSNSKSTHGSILTLGGASRKRKEREIGIGGGGGGGNSGFDAFALKASKKATTPTMAPNRNHNYMINKAEPKLQQQQQQPKTNEDNRLLAGFLAHEFLTKGTLLGQKWDPARAEAIPISPRRPNLIRKAGAVAGGGAGSIKSTALAELIKPVKKHESYAEVANLLKCDGVHIEGIVNPTQLARWFKM